MLVVEVEKDKEEVGEGRQCSIPPPSPTYFLSFSLTTILFGSTFHARKFIPGFVGTCNRNINTGRHS